MRIDYTISRIYASDIKGNRLVDALLQAEGISRDQNLDYTCGIFDANGSLIATGSCFGNTLRCLAVDSAHQGEGLMNAVVTHLTEIQFARENTRLFLYTKCSSAKFFQDLGFYEIARVTDRVVFMENQRTGFSDYLKNLDTQKKSGQKAAALVVNANPFTLGHLYLVEKAAAENEVLHLFIVSEDISLVPFSVRKRLVMEGTAHLKNICYHDSGPYIISNATFPSYFLKDAETVIHSHALLDLTIFIKIAEVLGITRRYVGEEPTSQVTAIYNRTMQEELPKAGIECLVIPRKESQGKPISASTVRQAIKEGNLSAVRSLVPESTYRFFLSEEAAPIIQKIKAADHVIHY